MPVATKANTPETGADVQGRWGTHVSEPISPSQRRQRCLYGGGGEQNKETRGGVAKFPMCRRAQSFPLRQVTVPCASVTLASATLAPRLKVSTSPGAGTPEGECLYILKSVPWSFVQTCCSCTSYTLALRQESTH